MPLARTTQDLGFGAAAKECMHLFGIRKMLTPSDGGRATTRVGAGTRGARYDAPLRMTPQIKPTQFHSVRRSSDRGLSKKLCHARAFSTVAANRNSGM